MSNKDREGQSKGNGMGKIDLSTLFKLTARFLLRNFFYILFVIILLFLSYCEQDYYVPSQKDLSLSVGFIEVHKPGRSSSVSRVNMINSKLSFAAINVYGRVLSHKDKRIKVYWYEFDTCCFLSDGVFALSFKRAEDDVVILSYNEMIRKYISERDRLSKKTSIMFFFIIFIIFIQVLIDETKRWRA
ncbi:hypothetical protein [Amphritea japonica]|uniref:hypothetical protein n=1 Tax=Amphritea japonica TaxID=452627 RepID=UPI0003651180|nr:hypothetical protein [Amphritea japonica]